MRAVTLGMLGLFVQTAVSSLALAGPSVPSWTPCVPDVCVPLSSLSHDPFDGASCGVSGRTDAGVTNQHFALTDALALTELELSLQSPADKCYVVAYSHVSLLSAPTGPAGERSRARYAGVLEVDAVGTSLMSTIADEVTSPFVATFGDEEVVHDAVQLFPVAGSSPTVRVRYSGDLSASLDGSQVECELGPPGMWSDIAISLAHLAVGPHAMEPLFCFDY